MSFSDAVVGRDTIEAAEPGRVPRYRGAFGRLYRSELRLVLTRRRNLVLLAVLAALPVFIGIAVKVNSPRAGDGPQFIGQISDNGLFLVFTSLTVALPFFLPLVVGVITGDSVAGEAGLGTLRYLLTVPVSRTRVVGAKTAAAATVAAIAVLTVCLSGVAVGGVLFGLRSLVLLSGDTVSLPDALARTLAVAAYLTVALFGLAAGGIFISTLTENAIAAMTTTVGIAVLSQLLDAVPQLSSIHSGLLTHHWLDFGELLRSSVDTTALMRWSALHLVYAAIFLSLAWARMVTKDVTS